MKIGHWHSGFGAAAGLKSRRFNRKRDSCLAEFIKKANTRLPCIVRWVAVVIDL